MAETVALALASKLTVTVTATGVFVSTGDNTITISGLDETLNLNAASTPAVSKQASGQLVLSSGAGTLDLTALPGLSADETVTLNTLKPQALKVRNKSSNANSMTLTKGASNGWSFCGTSAFTIPLAPGQSALLWLDGAAGTVGSGAKTIDVAGSGSQILEWEIVGG